jgi:hypothetical protein
MTNKFRINNICDGVDILRLQLQVKTNIICTKTVRNGFRNSYTIYAANTEKSMAIDSN